MLVCGNQDLILTEEPGKEWNPGYGKASNQEGYMRNWQVLA